MSDRKIPFYVYVQTLYYLHGFNFRTQFYLRAHVNIIVISLDGFAIKQVELARFLGVHIDGNVNWKSQISHVCSKIAQIPVYFVALLCRVRAMH